MLAPAESPAVLLDARDVTRTYTIDDRAVDVVANVSLRIEEGEFVAIQGSSGSGKSTLLTLLLPGLDRPSRGRIVLDGHDITDLSEDDLATLRNRLMGFVFQSFHLVPSLSAWDNVAFPAELAGTSDAREQARDLLDRVGLSARLNSLPHQLSGGEKQRVAICRALVNRPRIVFADEPTGNLDSRSGQGVLALLQDTHRERHTALVLVTHSADIAAAASRRIVLEDGRIVRS